VRRHTRRSKRGAFDTITGQIEKRRRRQHLVVKIDAEAPRGLFAATPDVVFEPSTRWPSNSTGPGREAEVVQRETFLPRRTPAPGNYICWDSSRTLPCWAHEVLFVNKRLTLRYGTGRCPPSPLDAPNSTSFEESPETPVLSRRSMGPG
jgi:hypothetical protein